MHKASDFDMCHFEPNLESIATASNISAFFHFRKTLVTGKLPPKLLLSLCSSLLMTLVLFLAAVEETSSTIGCKAVAGLIQYFLLATFAWMAVEAVNLYRSVVNPMTQRGAGKKKFFIAANALAWGESLFV